MRLLASRLLVVALVGVPLRAGEVEESMHLAQQLRGEINDGGERT